MKNPTLLQYFHWYYPEGGQLWPELAERAGGLNDIGINMVWLPPAYKGASGGYSVGYDSYDLFDLGEFDQKGTVATKYGDKNQLLAAIDALKHNDIAVLLDVVVNHKMGADEKENIRVQRVNAEDRTKRDDEVVDCDVLSLILIIRCRIKGSCNIPVSCTHLTMRTRNLLES